MNSALMGTINASLLGLAAFAIIYLILVPETTVEAEVVQGPCPINVETQASEIKSWQDYAIEQCGGAYDKVIITADVIEYVCADKDNVTFKLN